MEEKKLSFKLVEDHGHWGIIEINGDPKNQWMVQIDRSVQLKPSPEDKPKVVDISDYRKK